ncbi:MULTISPECIES: cellulose synthase complex periplasmic endoglucanase BcsZ [unclassified Pseudomonas]|uniref:cellulose synthase complex periplasmic endoglucanase BcsZ n=1 Tax=unclassified Pseudomonas TaxID=196821 RepID=UPI00136A41D3|nr:MULTISPECIES: cellulose synthase complex periplasmic endoglucanase BcsZ [unclassified Pseudomonas]MCH4870569.1 cellulase [Pseudomonas sp. TMW22089]NBG92705.1 cellulase [Pseudomonas sp. 9.1(2019)]
MGRLAALALSVTLGALPQVVSAATCNWPAWDSYKKAMMSADGRIIDSSSAQLITTSEGQSYGLFFALVGNDRQGFAKILDWTRNNLAQGNLDKHLPAWQWGQSKSGKWQVLDSNNASDSDLWIAYSLLEAGRLWQWPAYIAQGQNMLWRSAAQSLRTLPGLGLMLLPGDVGFDSDQGWRLNPSYMPPQLLARFAQISPIWAELASNQQRLLIEGSPKGFAPDWLLWQAAGGWAPDPKDGSAGDYDAIRVYLWLGMLAPDATNRQTLQQHFAPMVNLTRTLGYPPESVDAITGTYTGTGPVGFSGALLPLLASADSPALAVQQARVQQDPPAADAYYNQSLLLFGQGWDQQRYRFDKDGRLSPAWANTCKN